MDARQVTTNKQIEGRFFTFSKFTAFDGIMVGKLVVAKALPMVQDFVSPEMLQGSFKDAVADVTPQVLEKLDLTTIAGALEDISEKDLKYLMQKCLTKVAEQLEGGPTPVMDGAGNYRIPDVEYDPQLMIALVWEQLKFGLSDFFIGKRWASTLGLTPKEDTASTDNSISLAEPIV